MIPAFSLRPDETSCLGVTASVTGRRWVESCDGAETRIALAIAQSCGVPDLVARVLAGRGIGIEEASRFLEPRLRDLMPDPYTLKDMEKAAQRLAKAVRLQEKTAIFGDYDVDGACSAALLANFLKTCGLATLVHIPDRITEGYGPNIEAIRQFHAQGARLVVTVDCGASSHAPFEEATRLGMDVVVLDHHQVPETLPEVHALVDPNRQDDLSGFGYLCAAGVVFLCLVALRRLLKQERLPAQEPDLMAELDLVALASVADVVPLKGLNRAFIRQGLQVMRARTRPGLAALLDTSGLKSPPQAWHLGFLLGPRINAGGRIGDAGLGARLLTTSEPLEASRIASELDRLNRERQVIEQQAIEEAESKALIQMGQNPNTPLIIVAGAWHPGIVGLIASRLKERFRRPSFAFAMMGNQATGSGRSVPGIDLGKAVRRAVEDGQALKGGGHAMAAGATIAADAIDAFGSCMASLLGSEGTFDDTLAIDAVLSAGSLQPSLVHALDKAGPFGSGHPEPLFAFARQKVIDVMEVGSGGHLRLRLKGPDGADLTAIAFRAAGQPLGQALSQSRGRSVHIAGTLNLNAFGGREKVEVRVVDVAIASPPL